MDALIDRHRDLLESAVAASLTDAAFVANRFELAMWRRPMAA